MGGFTDAPPIRYGDRFFCLRQKPINLSFDEIARHSAANNSADSPGRRCRDRNTSTLAPSSRAFLHAAMPRARDLIFYRAILHEIATPSRTIPGLEQLEKRMGFTLPPLHRPRTRDLRPSTRSAAKRSTRDFSFG